MRRQYRHGACSAQEVGKRTEGTPMKRIVLPAFVILAGLGGCDIPDEISADAECLADHQCADGLRCVAERCVPADGDSEGEGEAGQGEGAGGDGEGGRCRNGVVDTTEGEACDPGQTACSFYGAFDDGEVLCADDCSQVDMGWCRPAVCGDDVRAYTVERCERGETDTCKGANRTGAGVPCHPTECRFDYSVCGGAPECVKDGFFYAAFEECDPTALGIEWRCPDSSDGVATCADDCRLELSGCAPLRECGNGDVESGEECDEGPGGNVDDGVGCSRLCLEEEVADIEPPHEPPGADGQRPSDRAFVFDSVCHEPAVRAGHADREWIGLRVAVHRVTDAEGGPRVSAEQIAAHIAAVQALIAPLRVRFELVATVDVPLAEVRADDLEAWARTYVREERLTDPSAVPVLFTPMAWGGLSSASGIIVNPRAAAWFLVEAWAHELGHFASLSHTHACPAGVRRDSDEGCGLWGDSLCDTPYDPGPARAGGSCRDFGVGGEVCALDPAGCLVECAGEVPAGGQTANPSAANVMSWYLGQRCGPREFSPEQAATLRCVLREEQRSVSFPMCADGRAPGAEVCNGIDDDCDGVVDVGADCADAGDGAVCEAGRCIAPPEPPPADDGLEDNDAAEAARALAEGDHAGLVVLAADEDWYAVELAAGRRLTVRVTRTGGGGDIELELHDAADGGLLAASRGAGPTEQASVDSAAGPRSVRIRVYLAGGLRGKYDLLVTDVGLPCVDQDGDGFGAYCPAGPDCRDGDRAVNPDAQELCDGVDNDCDRSADEGYGAGQACVVGVGACARVGVVVCAEDGVSAACGAAAGAPAEELCNGLDDDCDGVVDGRPTEDAPGLPVRLSSGPDRTNLSEGFENADGGFWAAGAVGGSAALWQVDPDGRIGQGFPVLDQSGVETSGKGVAGSADGTVWLSGRASDGAGWVTRLWRHSPEGALLDGFPVDVEQIAGRYTAVGAAIVAAPAGGAWLAAHAGESTDCYRGYLHRVDAAGTAAEGFPLALIAAELPNGECVQVRDLAVDPDGDVWLAASVGQRLQGERRPGVWRFSTDGELRPGFPALAVVGGPGSSVVGSSLALDPAGGAHVAFYNNDAEEAGVVRVLNDGSVLVDEARQVGCPQGFDGLVVVEQIRRAPEGRLDLAGWCGSLDGDIPTLWSIEGEHVGAARRLPARGGLHGRAQLLARSDAGAVWVGWDEVADAPNGTREAWLLRTTPGLGFPIAGLCEAGEGVCAVEGAYACAADGRGVVCDAEPADAEADRELCNGIDDDCDGVVDGRLSSDFDGFPMTLSASGGKDLLHDGVPVEGGGAWIVGSIGVNAAIWRVDEAGQSEQGFPVIDRGAGDTHAIAAAAADQGDLWVSGEMTEDGERRPRLWRHAPGGAVRDGYPLDFPELGGDYTAPFLRAHADGAGGVWLLGFRGDDARCYQSYVHRVGRDGAPADGYPVFLAVEGGDECIQATGLGIADDGDLWVGGMLGERGTAGVLHTVWRLSVAGAARPGFPVTLSPEGEGVRAGGGHLALEPGGGAYVAYSARQTRTGGVVYVGGDGRTSDPVRVSCGEGVRAAPVRVVSMDRQHLVMSGWCGDPPNERPAIWTVDVDAGQQGAVRTLESDAHPRGIAELLLAGLDDDVWVGWHGWNENRAADDALLLRTTPGLGFPVGARCTSGRGVCATEGVLTCTDDELDTECGAVPSDPDPDGERCDDADHDCDGLATNGFDVGADCVVGVGVCLVEGLTVCAADGLDAECDAVPGDAAPSEACDGEVDADCDGLLPADDPDCTLPLGRRLVLSDGTGPAGTSARRRRNEPIEIPLVAGGYLDSSVVVHLPLDGVEPDRNGRPSGATRFDGATKVDVVGSEELPTFERYTLSAWIRPDDVDAHMRLIWRGRDDLEERTNFGVQRLSTGEFRAGHEDAQDRDLGFPGSVGGAPPDRWAQVVVAYDGVRMALFVNGSLAGSVEILEPAGGAGAPIIVGGDADGGSFQGLMDEVVILDRALTPLEVRHYYESRRTWGSPLFPGAQADHGDLVVTEDGAPIAHELIGAGPLADRTADLDEHVVAYWPLDGSEEDLGPGGFAMEPVLDAPAYSQGRYGRAPGALDGTAGLAWLRTQAAGFVQPAAGGFTVEAWVRPGVGRNGFSHVLFDVSNDQPDVHGARIVAWQEGPRLKCNVEAEDGVPGDPPATGSLATGEWHHLACVRRGDQLETWLDGREVASLALPGGLDLRPSGRVSLGGVWSDDPEPRFHGVLDEVVVHNIARSPDYLYRRAHPLPRVRFLAATADAPDGDRWAYRDYRIRWGSPDAESTAVHDLLDRIDTAGWWRFDDKLVAPIIDTSTARLHAPTAGVAAAGLPDRPGGALGFGGEAVGAPVPRPNDADGSWTLEAWARPEAPSGRLRLVIDDRGVVPDEPEAPAAGRHLAMNSVGKWVCGTDDGAGDVGEVEAAAPSDAATWYHLACIYDGQTLSLIVDGGEPRTSPAGRYLGTAAPDLHIGGHFSDENAGGWAGDIDEVRISARALSPEELLYGATTTWTDCADLDGDGYDTCAPNSPGDGDGFAADCEDDQATAHPEGQETCDGVDNDCDGAIDEGWELRETEASRRSLDMRDARIGDNLAGVGRLVVGPTTALLTWAGVSREGTWAQVLRHDGTPVGDPVRHAAPGSPAGQMGVWAEDRWLVTASQPGWSCHHPREDCRMSAASISDAGVLLDTNDDLVRSSPGLAHRIASGSDQILALHAGKREIRVRSMGPDLALTGLDTVLFDAPEGGHVWYANALRVPSGIRWIANAERADGSGRLWSILTNDLAEPMSRVIDLPWSFVDSSPDKTFVADAERVIVRRNIDEEQSLVEIDLASGRVNRSVHVEAGVHAMERYAGHLVVAGQVGERRLAVTRLSNDLRPVAEPQQLLLNPDVGQVSWPLLGAVPDGLLIGEIQYNAAKIHWAHFSCQPAE